MTSNLPHDRLSLRPREAAKAIGVSERTLWSWTHNGEIPHVRMGKAILYPVDTLRQWLDSKTTHATAESTTPDSDSLLDDLLMSNMLEELKEGGAL